VQFVRIVDDPKVVVARVQNVVRRGTHIEDTVQPGEISIRAIAAELGSQLEFDDLSIELTSEALDLIGLSDVLQRDTLVFVDEEHGAARSTHQFFDLVVAQVAVQATLRIEAMRFVDDEDIEGIGHDFHVGTGPGEQVTDPRSRERAGQLRLVHSARRRVLRDVPGVAASSDQRGQQVDGHDRLARTRPAADDDDLLALRPPGRRLQYGLVDQLLIVDQDELRLALKQSGDAVHQGPGRANSPILDRIQRAASVAVAHMFTDERLEPRLLPLQKERRTFHVLRVVRVIDFAVARVIVHVGTRLEADAVDVHRLIEVFQVRCVGPCLVRRMRPLSISGTSSTACPDDSVLVAATRGGTLLELDDDHLRSGLIILAHHQEVDALGRLRQPVLDRHTCLGRNFVIVQHLGHLDERVLPRLEFRGPYAVAHRCADMPRNDFFDVVSEGVLEELLLAGLIDDHARDRPES
jgi:hypothetical protein